MAMACWRLNKKKLCKVNCQKALKLQPENAKANNYLGNLYRESGKLQKAKECYLNAVSYDPSNAFGYYNLGLVCFELKEYELAKDNLQKAKDKAPDYVYTYIGLGNLYLELKEYKPALEAFENAKEKGPNIVYPYNGLGDVYRNLKETELAAKAYDKAIEINPKYKYSYNGLGLLYLDLDNYNQAIEEFEKAKRIDNKYVYPYINLGNIYLHLKKYQKAKKYYEIAKGLDSNMVYPYNGLGNLYQNLKKTDLAEVFYKDAILKDQNYVWSYFNLGLLYLESNDKDNAIIAFNDFIKKSENKNKYYVIQAKFKIEEIKKSKKRPEFGDVVNFVEEIKSQLLFDDFYVTHYTSTSTTMQLLLSDSVFRLSEGTYLNDTSEGNELLIFLNLPNSQNNKNKGTFDFPFTSKPFIGSFVAVEKHNDLNLWRLYGKENKEDATGCSITINQEGLVRKLKDKLLQENSNDKQTSLNVIDDFSFYRVAYINKDLKEKKNIFSVPSLNNSRTRKLNKAINSLKVAVDNYKKVYKTENERQDLYAKVNEITYLFKSTAYLYEHEVRLVLSGIGFDNDKCVEANELGTKVYINSAPIPTLIKKITIGPKVKRAEELAAAFYYKLAKSNLKPEIVISTLPFK
jgi:tetratricopeptide (TPR) repeat protein